MKVDYRGFIQDNFHIRTVSGEIVPFIFNDVQNLFYDEIISKNPEMKGVRENILKARQEGFSSVIEGIFTVDFILAGLEVGPLVDSQVISHKMEEIKPHFNRVNLFLDSWLEKSKNERRKFLASDSKGSYLQTWNKAQFLVGSAGAKTLGRGGTLQNLHWSEIAFYPNTPVLNSSELVVGAEQQVADGIGKIFRESTGRRRTDFFAKEYFRGKGEDSSFNSGFYPWFMERRYRKPVPDGYRFDEESLLAMNKNGIRPDQMYWYISKMKDSEDPALFKREYPMTDTDAFIASGQSYFEAQALERYTNRIKEPIREGVIYV